LLQRVKTQLHAQDTQSILHFNSDLVGRKLPSTNECPCLKLVSQCAKVSLILSQSTHLTDRQMERFLLSNTKLHCCSALKLSCMHKTHNPSYISIQTW